MPKTTTLTDFSTLATNVLAEMSHGGDWLAAGRRWMQSNVRRGDVLSWGSGEPVTIPFCKLEELVKTSVAAALVEERIKRVNAVVSTAPPTPSSSWSVTPGEVDPHIDPQTGLSRYGVSVARTSLTLGRLTDDALANAAYLNYDRRPSPQELIAGTGYSPLTYMTAVKERIRLLSRNLDAALAEISALKRAAAPATAETSAAAATSAATSEGAPNTCESADAQTNNS